ncbi:uncharacterized protein TNCV_644561 [Trichonephila clavipes]|nr:uncharacterized protein TNCV_644561 [Trichonephila clavipes]
MLFQNDILIDVACHRYTLNMQINSGTKNNSSPNEPSCTNVTVSFNCVLLVVTGNCRSPYESPARIKLQTKPGIVRKNHTRTLLWCPQCMCTRLQVKEAQYVSEHHCSATGRRHSLLWLDVFTKVAYLDAVLDSAYL